MTKFLALHGFLGHPNDFDFLKNNYEIIAPDLSKLVELEKEELFSHLIDLIKGESINHIIGYSFGARLGLSLKVERKLELPLFCLAGHMGLEGSEIENRIKIENEFCKRIKGLNDKEFLNYWNQLQLFQFDKPLTKMNYNNAILFFEKYSLSKQLELIPLVHEKRGFYFLYGDKDTKYKDYALKSLSGFDVEFIENAGHRIINHPNWVLKWLERKLND